MRASVGMLMLCIIGGFVCASGAGAQMSVPGMTIDAAFTPQQPGELQLVVDPGST